jgi:predicted alpha/beta-fold hydrolase
LTIIRKYSVLESVLRRLQQLTQSAEGYLWTILPAIKDTAKPTPSPPEESWETSVSLDGAPAILTGLYTPHAHPKGLVVIVPGLGASPKSSYCHRATSTLLGSGYSSLRLGTVRCPTRRPDFHRLELADQLTVALAQPPLDRYTHVILLGYSIGGHGALRAVATDISERVSALALVSTPFDLSISQSHIDSPLRKFHRGYFLNMLKDVYKTGSKSGHFPEPPQGLFQARTLRDLDASLISVDTHRPEPMERFYREISARWTLDRIKIPVLAVLSPTDPMIPPHSVVFEHPQLSPDIDIRWHPGGHIYFPPNTDLGEAGPRGLLPQMIAWWERKTSPADQIQGKSSMNPTLWTS